MVDCLGIFCSNIGSNDREVQIDPAAHIANNVFDLNEGAEVTLPADRRAHMRPGEAGLDVLEADTVSLAVTWLSSSDQLMSACRGSDGNGLDMEATSWMEVSN